MATPRKRPATITRSMLLDAKQHGTTSPVATKIDVVCTNCGETRKVTTRKANFPVATFVCFSCGPEVARKALEA